jgi:hypothetical protein
MLTCSKYRTFEPSTNSAAGHVSILQKYIIQCCNSKTLFSTKTKQQWINNFFFSLRHSNKYHWNSHTTAKTRNQVRSQVKVSGLIIPTIDSWTLWSTNTPQITTPTYDHTELCHFLKLSSASSCVKLSVSVFDRLS